MFNFLVTAEGGLTTAGYAVSVIAVLILIILVAVLLQKNTSALKFTTQQLVTCAVALALAYVTSYIKIFKLPFGGSVTLFSMLFIVLIGYWYGIKVGILTGLVYGIFQFLQEPYVLSFFGGCRLSVSTSCHYSHSPKCTGYCRNRNYYDRQYTFQKNITVIVNNRIQSCQRLREIIRHIIHPIKISAKCMECPSCQNC